MKVGLISYHTFFQPGGVKRHILGLHKEFKNKGIYSKIIAPRRKKTEDYGKEVILLGTSFPFPFSGALSDFAINFNPLAVDEVLKREQFDVLHFHNFGLSAFQILERSNSLNILTFHASLEGNKFLERFPVFLKIVEKIAQWKIDGIIGVAPLNLKYFKKYSGPKIVIPNGIDLEKFNPEVPPIRRRPFNQKGADPKLDILFLGRIEKRKGLIYLLKAFKILEKKYSNTELPFMTAEVKKRAMRINPHLPPSLIARRTKSSSPLRLIVAGEGPLKSECQNWAGKNKLKNVIFEGKINEEKAPFYYRSCDIFCSPATFGESFGLVLVEAMASGLPVVAFANEGYKGVLTGLQPTHHPPANGGPLGARFLAKPMDYKALAKKLEILIKNESLRKEMGKWGVKEVQKYAWPKIADRVLDFYELCRREKEKRPKPSFSLEKSLRKILKNFEKLLFSP